MASDKILIVTDDDFEEKVIKNPLPVVVDFWAEWCGPCRMVAPTLEEIAGQYEGRAVVAKLNVDDSPLTPTKFEIQAIPTMIFFKNGEELGKIVGVEPKKNIEAKLDTLL